MAASQDHLLQEQISYYRARAQEYDEWFLRQGRFDHGPEENARWHTELASVGAALDTFLASALHDTSALELAAGTGQWTPRLAKRFDDLTVVDAAPEALALNRERLGSRADSVQFVVADLFDWRPTRRYDIVFFGFWLSHVPPEQFAAFWELVRDCLAPGGRAFLVDSAYTPDSTARDHTLAGPDATAVTRRLNDGSEYRIVKVFYRPERLRAELATLGWQADLHETPKYFLYGSAAPAAHSG